MGMIQAFPESGGCGLVSAAGVPASPPVSAPKAGEKRRSAAAKKDETKRTGVFPEFFMGSV
jgi:hypothetical protein